MKKEELQNQIYLYSLETKDFYTDEEKAISDKYSKALYIKKKINQKKESTIKTINFIEEKNKFEEMLDVLYKKIDRYEFHLKYINSFINDYKGQLNDLINQHQGVRFIRPDALKIGKIVSLFESSLTRTYKLRRKEVTEDLFIVRIYHYQILHSIMNNGFTYNSEHYKYFTSSAGQIRTKKIVCTKTSVYDKYEKTITCGLTEKEISDNGINLNKYQAYLALINSASAIWEGFNIDKVIVVDDMETLVKADVDYIDRNSYEITRIKGKQLPIEHMDGCGIMLPSISEKSFMFRMPWMKGMLTPFDFKKFVNTFERANPIIKDIYGKEYNILEDDIQIIMTKSQFKLSGHYKNWNDYKKKFKDNSCEATRLNIEDIGSNTTINYQMLQTLTTITDEELEKIAFKTKEEIRKIGSDRKTMLKVLGATKENIKKNYFQQALMLYQEMLSDGHVKETIKSKKKKLVKNAKAGKLKVNGNYTFLIPDIFAFCEWLFMGSKSPRGLLKNGEVYCNIFKEGKVDVLRAPHLYKEHAIRENTLKEEISNWFITKGIYTSVHDPISRVLQFDNDGDKSLVLQDETIINIAEDEMTNIVPLYYEMKKAKDEEINPNNMYKALTSAYKANIGIISNDITKIWNSPSPSLDAVKWLTMYNNFVIDYAKTLYLPEPPKHVEEEIKRFTKSKMPRFFMHAKDKDSLGVEKINNSTVNKLHYIIEDKRIVFEEVVGKFDYKMLLDKKRVKVSDEIVDRFIELKKEERYLTSDNIENKYYFNQYVREELKKINRNESYIADSLVAYLYPKHSKMVDSLWNIYGNILYKNLVLNLKGTINCELCCKRVKSNSGRQKYCDKCSKIADENKQKDRVKRFRNSK